MWKVISKRLSEIGMTDYRLSKEIGVPRGTVSNWRLGKNRVNRFDLVVKIADALDMDINILADAMREEVKERGMPSCQG